MSAFTDAVAAIVAAHSNTNPAAWYRCNEASGTVATDSSGNSRPGTISATGVTYGVAGLADSSDSALTFNGAATNGGELQASSNAALYRSGAGGAGDFTIVCWFKDWISGDTAIFRDNSGSQGTIGPFASASNVAGRIQNTTIATTTALTAVQDGNRHMATLRRSGTAGTLWIDRTQRGSATVATTGPAIPWHFGRNGTGTAAADFTSGTFDEILIFPYALTDAEIQSLWDAGTSIQGSGTPMLASLALSASGTVASSGSVSGTGSPTLSSVSSSASGAVLVQGSGASTLAVLSGSRSGTVMVQGTLSKAMASPALSSSGAALVQGSGTPSLGTVSLSATGAVGNVPISGSGSPTLGALSLSGSGAVLNRGSGTPAMLSMAASGAAAVLIQGSGSGVLATATASAAGTVRVAGSGSPTLALPTSIGAGSIAIRGSGSAPLAALSLTGTGAIGQVATGSGSPQLTSLTASGTGTLAISGTGDGLLSLTASGSAKVVVSGSGSNALSLAGDGAGQVLVRCSGSPSLGVHMLLDSRPERKPRHRPGWDLYRMKKLYHRRELP